MNSVVTLVSIGAAEESFVAVASHNIDYASNATISFFVTWLGDVLSVIRESLNPMLATSPIECPKYSQFRFTNHQTRNMLSKTFNTRYLH
jgi:hypothetical protein